MVTEALRDLCRETGTEALAVNATLPRHIAVVMDGNGRWAERRGLSRRAGHRAGYRAVRSLVREAPDRGIRHLTVFAFSSENWRRPHGEVDALMSLFLHALRREVAELHANGVRLDFIGERERLSPDLKEATVEAESLTEGNSRLALHAAVGRLDPADVDEDVLRGAMALPEAPDPDLFIRTGGECRISNFLLWNLAYTELYFTDTLWPDFDAAALDDALDSYARRRRRFGGVPAGAHHE